MVSAVESVCRVPSFTEFSFRYCGYFSSFFLFERFLRILLGWTLKYALISFRLLPNFLRLPMTNGVGCRVRLSSTEFYRVFFLVLWVFFFLENGGDGLCEGRAHRSIGPAGPVGACVRLSVARYRRLHTI